MNTRVLLFALFAQTGAFSPAQSPGNAHVSMKDYEFIPPAGWQVQTTPDQILLTQVPDQSGCLMHVLPPQASSGDLERDARAVFDMMYQGYNYQHSGERQYLLSRGVLPKGLEFCLLEAPMNITTADGRYHLEDGAAMVVKAKQQIAIVAVRHRGLLAHTDCLRKYDTWRRFFNSFNVKGVPAADRGGDDAAQRILGVWTHAESGASSEYVFAANGNYAHGGALGSTSTSRDVNTEYLHIKSYAFEGDGRYSIADHVLTLQPRGGPGGEQIRLRFEQANRGGTGWKDRLWLLKNDRFGQNEVCFERRGGVPPQAHATRHASPRPTSRARAVSQAPSTTAVSPPNEAPENVRRIEGAYFTEVPSGVRPWIVLFGGDGRIAGEAWNKLSKDSSAPFRGRGTYQVHAGTLSIALEDGYKKVLPISVQGPDPVAPERVVINGVTLFREKNPPVPLPPATSP